MQIPSTEVDQVPTPPDLPIVDVREADEWVAGHIEGAVHIPLSTLPVRLADLPEGKLLVTCKVGGRSAQAVAYLTQQGYDAVNLSGGMLDWQAAGRPMVSETDDEPFVL